MTITSFGPANRIARTAETHPLTWRLRDDGEPVWLAEYESKNGYAAARKALADMSADEIVQSVKDSGLKGRGGAGFPTGVKWGLMPKDESMNIRYLLCNADEMEPNTWKDRMLMEQQPHLLVEGMLISARALKAYRGYIFLRGEYTTAAKNLNRAIDEAKAAGLLGKNILGSGFDFELFVHTGAGRYICGEETALINSLEGRRANPRSKPPFPAAVGVWGKPTCVNNVTASSSSAGSQAAPVPASCCPSTSTRRCTPVASPKSAPAWVRAWPWRSTTASTWCRCCATWKSSSPASRVAGAPLAVTACRGA